MSADIPDLGPTLDFLRATYGHEMRSPREAGDAEDIEARAARLAEEGMDAGARHQFRDAVTAFDHAMYLLGETPALLVARSMAWRALHQDMWAYCDAAEALERAGRGEPLSLTPEDRDALAGYVAAFEAAHRLALPRIRTQHAADRAWNRAFRAWQDHARERALGWLGESLRAQPTPAACVYGAAWLAAMGHATHALAVLDQVPALDPIELEQFYAGGFSAEQVEQLRSELIARVG